jgi:GH24 family phage-related lysozyme (muramidase)
MDEADSMSAQYELDFLPQLRINEGCFATMYSDTKGNVTCGVGFLLQSAQTACGYPWYIPGLVTPATAQEIAAEWNRVKAMQPGQLPHFYAIETALQLRQDSIDAHTMTLLDTLDDGLTAGIPNFEELPDEWKMALADMGWNLGLHGLLNGYPRMLAAIEAGDGATAATECHRNGISDARNQWCALQFSGTVEG